MFDRVLKYALGQQYLKISIMMTVLREKNIRTELYKTVWKPYFITKF